MVWFRVRDDGWRGKLIVVGSVAFWWGFKASMIGLAIEFLPRGVVLFLGPFAIAAMSSDDAEEREA